MTAPVIARSQDMQATVRLWALTGPQAGEWVDRAPIDARAMLAFPGAWSLTPPGTDAVTELAPTDAPVDVPLAVTNSFDAGPSVAMALPKGRAARAR